MSSDKSGLCGASCSGTAPTADPPRRRNNPYDPRRARQARSYPGVIVPSNTISSPKVLPDLPFCTSPIARRNRHKVPQITIPINRQELALLRRE